MTATPFDQRPPFAHADAPQSAPSILRACGQLFALSLRRQFCSRQTLVCLGLALLLTAIVTAWSFQPDRTTKQLADRVLSTVFVGFLLPIIGISYGASSIGGEREDRTLIYLLLTPIPRPLVYLTKAVASLCLACGFTAVSLLSFCWLAGELGRPLLPVFFPACVLGAAAYAALFQLLGTAFRHGTIISLAYWFFLEVLFGAMPGMVKRITVSFFVRSGIYGAGEDLLLGPRSRVNREMFLAVSESTAYQMLTLFTIGFVLLGAWLFARREYRELG